MSLIAATGADEAVFYRTDGKAPTTGSTRYSGPINLTKTTTISAAVIDTTTGESGPVTHGIYTAVASSMATRTSNLPLLVIDPAKTIKRDSRLGKAHRPGSPRPSPSSTSVHRTAANSWTPRPEPGGRWPRSGGRRRR